VLSLALAGIDAQGRHFLPRLQAGCPSTACTDPAELRSDCILSVSRSISLPAHRAVIEIAESFPDRFPTDFLLYYRDWLNSTNKKGTGQRSPSSPLCKLDDLHFLTDRVKLAQTKRKPPKISRSHMRRELSSHNFITPDLTPNLFPHA
jgi:hypothetical protein